MRRSPHRGMNLRLTSAIDQPNEVVFMPKIASREIWLASRPNGIPTAANFTLARTELEPPQDQEVLVRNLFMSVDPYMRGRMNDGKSYVPDRKSTRLNSSHLVISYA